MKQARVENQAFFRPYTVTRNYKLFDKERQKAKSHVTADMTFVPPGFKSYAIHQANGAGLGETVVRRILANEVDIAKDQTSADFSTENYDFRLSREEYLGGRRCYVLELLPRRRAKNLLRGNIWVDAEAHLVHRLEGEPAKPPSWWLRRVRVVLLYGKVGGMWLQTGLEATANVRLLGPYRIVSHDVTYKLGALAVAHPPKRISNNLSRRTSFGNRSAGVSPGKQPPMTSTSGRMQRSSLQQ